MKMAGMSGSEKDAIFFHLAFGIIVLFTVSTSPLGRPEKTGIGLGLRIWVLLIGYHAAIILVALQRQHRDWLIMMKCLVPLSIFMIFPDGFLAIGLKTIIFPDMGVGQIFNVTSFMSFMWTIPLFVSTMAGRGIEARGLGTFRAALGAGFSGLIIFLGSEEILTLIPIWHPLENCSKIGHAAIYVLPPEFLIGVVTFLACRYCLSQPYSNQVSFPLQIFAAFMIMSMYLGNLIICFMVIDRDRL
mmetsp:Transcript_2446/g.3758  ORF Transcript_2446/g.3758 Transcript_2446/m.3758 type:complete len:244 (+) Transcript_2446:285-1016(+)